MFNNIKIRNILAFLVLGSRGGFTMKEYRFYQETYLSGMFNTMEEGLKFPQSSHMQNLGGDELVGDMFTRLVKESIQQKDLTNVYDLLCEIKESDEMVDYLHNALLEQGIGMTGPFVLDFPKGTSVVVDSISSYGPEKYCRQMLNPQDSIDDRAMKMCDRFRAYFSLHPNQLELLTSLGMHEPEQLLKFPMQSIDRQVGKFLAVLVNAWLEGERLAEVMRTARSEVEDTDGMIIAEINLKPGFDPNPAVEQYLSDTERMLELIQTHGEPSIWGKFFNPSHVLESLKKRFSPVDEENENEFIIGEINLNSTDTTVLSYGMVKHMISDPARVLNLIKNHADPKIWGNASPNHIFNVIINRYTLAPEDRTNYIISKINEPVAIQDDRFMNILTYEDTEVIGLISRFASPAIWGDDIKPNVVLDTLYKRHGVFYTSKKEEPKMKVEQPKINLAGLSTQEALEAIAKAIPDVMKSFEFHQPTPARAALDNLIGETKKALDKQGNGFVPSYNKAIHYLVAGILNEHPKELIIDMLTQAMSYDNSDRVVITWLLGLAQGIAIQQEITHPTEVAESGQPELTIQKENSPVEDHINTMMDLVIRGEIDSNNKLFPQDIKQLVQCITVGLDKFGYIDLAATIGGIVDNLIQKQDKRAGDNTGMIRRFSYLFGLISQQQYAASERALSAKKESVRVPTLADISLHDALLSIRQGEHNFETATAKVKALIAEHGLGAVYGKMVGADPRTIGALTETYMGNKVSELIELAFPKKVEVEGVEVRTNKALQNLRAITKGYCCEKHFRGHVDAVVKKYGYDVVLRALINGNALPFASNEMVTAKTAIERWTTDMVKSKKGENKIHSKHLGESQFRSEIPGTPFFTPLAIISSHIGTLEEDFEMMMKNKHERDIFITQLRSLITKHGLRAVHGHIVQSSGLFDYMASDGVMINAIQSWADGVTVGNTPTRVIF